MLLAEQMSDFVFRNVRILATDVDPQAGQRVSAGIYTEQEVSRVPSALRRRYFQAAGEPGCVQVVEELRGKVSFAEHDLLSLAPPRDDFSLIVCKNVLLHFDESQRRQVFGMFHRAMRSGGFLATEHTQKMPVELESLFEAVSAYAQVYLRLDAAKGVCSQFDGPHTAGIRGPREFPKSVEITRGRSACV
jgi:chemotaxis protein methyltransferase CheR